MTTEQPVHRKLRHWGDMGFPQTGPEWDGARRLSKHGGELAACLKEWCVLEDKGNNVCLLDAVGTEK